MSVQIAVPVTVIILTLNEAENLPDCLASVAGLTDEIFVVDSGSVDDTVDIAQNNGAKVAYHPFEDYSKQRNWAMENLPIQNEWVLHLDADHRVTPELSDTLTEVFRQNSEKNINGYLISRRTIFMGKWIKWGGHYPVYHAILFKRGKGHCEEKLYDQHFKVDGPVSKLRGDVINVFSDSLSDFTERHNRWSSMEAEDQIYQEYKYRDNIIQGNLLGNPMEKRRYLKTLYERLPLFVRPFIYFFVRYIIRLGFLDGKPGLIFHFLQGFWFRFLVDAKIYQIRHIARKTGTSVKEVLTDDFGVKL